MSTQLAIRPRPYQTESVVKVEQFLAERDDNPCVVIPTGGGKSPTMAMLAHKAITDVPDLRILVLAHVRELISQNADKMLRLWPQAPVGIYSAGLKRKDRFEPIIFGGIQSVRGKAMQLGRFDLILVDECHRIPLKDEGTYRAFLAEQKRINKDVRVIGFTATPWRMGGGPICAPEHVLNEIAHEVYLRDLVDDGYLTRPVSKSGVARADRSELVHTRNGEFVESEVNAAVMRGDLVERACKEFVELCHKRKAWLLFAASVAHAERIKRALEAHGFSGRVVSGDTDPTEREQSIAALKFGAVRFLVTINVLSEGYDEPRIDAIGMLRPTKSPVLYSQQVGRGTRPIYAPGFDLDTKDGRLAAIAHGPKPDCLVLDFAGNILEHGPVDQIVVQKPRKKGDKATLGKAQLKECPQCHAMVAVQTIKCECGHEWPRVSATHDDTATDAPIMSGEAAERQRVIREYPVTATQYFARESRQTGIPMLFVAYQCGVMGSFSDWVMLEHGGMRRAEAVQWWNERSHTHDRCVPRTVKDALDKAMELKTPKSLRVDETGKRPVIVGYNF